MRIEFFLLGYMAWLVVICGIQTYKDIRNSEDI
jgi:hypothetical protein